MIESSNIDRLRNLLGAYETAEEQLIVSNAYLAAIFDNANEAILAKDLHGIITAWNPAAERLYGHKAEEVIGQHVSLIIPEHKREQLTWIMSQIEQGNKLLPFETERRRKDGQIITVVLTISPIKDRTGSVIGASAIAHPSGEWSTVPYGTA